MPSGVENSSAIPTITAVPWIALPKPPPVKPGAGGNCVNTDGFNSGMPFSKSKKTIENNGIRVKNESVTHRNVQKLFLRILTLELRSTALRERALKPIEEVAVVMALSYSSGGFFGAAEDGLSSHVDEQSQQNESQCGIHEGAELKSVRLAELVSEESRKRSGG
jgi:hypothetical protein